MASPDAVGWPDEAVGFSSGSSRAEPRPAGAGLGWPEAAHGTGRRAVGSGRAGAGGSRSGASGARAGSQAMGKAGSGGQEQALAQASRAGARDQPARVRQALSAVSRETNARNLSAREEAQGSGTVRTRGKWPAAAVSAATAPGSAAVTQARTDAGPGAGVAGADVPGSPHAAMTVRAQGP